MKFFPKSIILCCLAFSSNVFGMEDLKIQDSQNWFTKMFFQRPTIQYAYFDDSKIEFRFTACHPVVIDSEKLDDLATQFIAEMNDQSKDYEINDTCALLIQGFGCYQNEAVMTSVKEYCSSVKCFYLMNKAFPVKTQYISAIAFMLDFLNPHHDVELQINFYSFPSDEYTKEIAKCFDKVIRFAVAQKLKCISDTYAIGHKLTEKLDIKEKISQDEYIERVMAEFNDPKFVSFVLKLSYNLAIQLLAKVAMMEAAMDYVEQKNVVAN